METFQKGDMVLTNLSRRSGADSSGRGGLWCCWMGKRTKNKIIAEKTMPYVILRHGFSYI